MSERKLRAIVKYPDEKPEETMLEDGYKTISEICHGLIDITTLPDGPSITLIVNDTSLVNGMRPNIVMPECKQVLCGPIVLLGANQETGISTSLTDEQAQKALGYLKDNEVHHMSLEGAYRYVKLLGPLRESEKEFEEEKKPEEIEA